MSEPLLITFAVNDDNGNLSGRCSGVEITESPSESEPLLQLEGIEMDECGRCRGVTRFDVYVQGEGCARFFVVRLGDVEFPIRRWSEHIGNMAWSGGYMTPETCAALVNLLRAQEGWSCDVAESSLSRKWERSETFTAQDFGAEPEPERPCPFTVPMSFEEVTA